jgi:hypothetical protein
MALKRLLGWLFAGFLLKLNGAASGAERLDRLESTQLIELLVTIKFVHGC